MLEYLPSKPTMFRVHFPSRSSAHFSSRRPSTRFLYGSEMKDHNRDLFDLGLQADLAMLVRSTRIMGMILGAEPCMERCHDNCLLICMPTFDRSRCT